MNTQTLLGCLAFGLVTSPLLAEDFVFKANYDESKIPAYELPEVLASGTSAEQWEAKRAEWHGLLANEMFGVTPAGIDPSVRVEVVGQDKPILDGKGFMRQIEVTVAGVRVGVVMFLPESSSSSPVPVFLGYNFNGNHTVFADSDIVLSTSWMRKAKDHKAQESERGSSANRWAVERIIDGGLGLVTLYYGDVDPDFDDGFHNGIHKKIGVPEPNEAASIASWAWALSRVLDVLEQTKEVDAARVCVFGHSRLGKTSLWAGANDRRFALVISNNSGCGGAALSRRMIGETVWRINDSFPHWFCKNFHKYSNREDEMPFDNHCLLALIAPRPLYVASAADDVWADPRGEFLSCLHADPVYKLLGTEGLPATEMPKVDAPVHGRIGYHIRSGKHDVTDYDWRQYIAFATKHLMND